MAHVGIESVLVAGRGPAACAVVAACSRLDVKTIAVHSEADRNARQDASTQMDRLTSGRKG